MHVSEHSSFIVLTSHENAHVLDSMARAHIKRNVRIMQKESVLVHLCWPRAFRNEVGLEKRCVSLTLKSVAGAQFVAFCWFVAMFSMDATIETSNAYYMIQNFSALIELN